MGTWRPCSAATGEPPALWSFSCSPVYFISVSPYKTNRRAWR
jgi:hypothetical protein